MAILTANQLALLDRVRGVLLRTPGDRRVLHEIARLVAASTSARVAAIAVEEAGRLRMYYGQLEGGPRLLEESMSPGEGAIGWALRHARTTVSSNVRFDVKYASVRALAARSPYVSMVAVPISGGERAQGALVAGYGWEREFSSHELALLEKVCELLRPLLSGQVPQQALHEAAREAAAALGDVLGRKVQRPLAGSPGVAEMAAMVGSRMGLGGDELDAVRLGAAILDIGEVMVPEQILKKPDRLTAEEFAVIKRHSEWGAMICKRASIFAPAYPVVYHHHERFDGSGYPERLSGESIPLAARVVTVADAYDALISDRPYRRAATPGQAVTLLREGAGRQWDPLVVETFVSVLASVNGPRFQVRRIPLN